MNRSILFGAFLSFLAFTTYACADVFTKLAGLDGVSAPFILALSGWSGLAVLLIYATAKRNLRGLLPKKLKLIFVLTAVILVQGIFNVISFTNLPLTTVYIGLFTMPLFVSIFGALFMGEPISRKQTYAIAIGFVGVLVALLPDILNTKELPTQGDPTIGYIALPFFIAGVVTMILLVRHIGKTESSESITFITVLTRCIILSPIFLIEPLTSIPTESTIYILLMGALSISGFIIMIRAYQLAPVAITSPFQYSQLITGALFGYAIWNTIPSVFVFIGGALIAIASIITTLEAHKQDKQAQLEANAIA